MDCFDNLFRSSGLYSSNELESLKRDLRAETEQAHEHDSTSNGLRDEIATLEQNANSTVVEPNAANELLAKINALGKEVTDMEKIFRSLEDNRQKEVSFLKSVQDQTETEKKSFAKQKAEMAALTLFAPDISPIFNETRLVTSSIANKITTATDSFDMAGLIGQISRIEEKQNKRAELIALRDVTRKKLAEMDASNEASRESVIMKEKELEKVGRDLELSRNLRKEREQVLAEKMEKLLRLKASREKKSAELAEKQRRKEERVQQRTSFQSRLEAAQLRKIENVSLLTAANNRLEAAHTAIEEKNELGEVESQMIQSRKRKDLVSAEVITVKKEADRLTKLLRIVELFEQKKKEVSIRSEELQSKIVLLDSAKVDKEKKMEEIQLNLENLRRSGEDKVKLVLSEMDEIKAEILKIRNEVQEVRLQLDEQNSKNTHLETTYKSVKEELSSYQQILKAKEEEALRKREQEEALAREEALKANKLREMEEEKKKARAKKLAEKERLIRKAMEKEEKRRLEQVARKKAKIARQQEEEQRLVRQREQEQKERERIAREEEQRLALQREEEVKERERLARQVAPVLLKKPSSNAQSQIDERKGRAVADLDDTLANSDGEEDNDDDFFTNPNPTHPPQTNKSNVVEGGEDTRETVRPNSQPIRQPVYPADDSLLLTDEDQEDDSDPFDISAALARQANSQKANNSGKRDNKSPVNVKSADPSAQPRSQANPLDDSLMMTDGEEDDSVDPFNVSAFLQKQSSAKNQPAVAQNKQQSVKPPIAKPAVARVASDGRPNASSKQPQPVKARASLDDSLMTSGDESDNNDFDLSAFFSQKPGEVDKTRSNPPRMDVQSAGAAVQPRSQVNPLDDSLMMTDGEEEDSVDPFNVSAFPEKRSSAKSQTAVSQDNKSGDKSVAVKASVARNSSDSHRNVSSKLPLPDKKSVSLDDSLMVSGDESDNNDFNPFFSQNPEQPKSVSQETILAPVRRRVSAGKSYADVDDSLMQSDGSDDDSTYNPGNDFFSREPTSAGGKMTAGKKHQAQKSKGRLLDESKICFNPENFTTSTPLVAKKPAPVKKATAAKRGRGSKAGRGKRGKN